MLTKPDGCIGGESCAIQPMVAVTYRSTSDIVYSFQGSVFVQIGSSPTGYDKLYYGNPCTFDSCGTEVVGSLVSVPFSNGMATFQVTNRSSFLSSQNVILIFGCLIFMRRNCIYQKLALGTP